MKKKLTFGPNDARRVVWACFHHRRSPFLFASGMSILNRKYNLKKFVSIKKMGKNTNLWPKRRWTRHLGPHRSW
jgi:hypothetical protein